MPTWIWCLFNFWDIKKEFMFKGKLHLIRNDLIPYQSPRNIFNPVTFFVMTVLFKWRILSRTSTEQSGKSEKKNISSWALSTPWGHVLSLKTFCRNPVLSWAIRYSVFQKVKSTSSLEFVCDDPFSTFWHLMVKFG